MPKRQPSRTFLTSEIEFNFIYPSSLMNIGIIQRYKDDILRVK